MEDGCGGRLLWEKLTSCTMLITSYRSECPRLIQVLSALRTGCVNQELYQILQARVLKHLSEECQLDFLQRGIVVTPTNAHRQAISLEDAIHAKNTMRPLVVLSVDVLAKTKQPLLETLHKVLWNLPQSQTKKIPGILILHPDCELLLCENDNPHIGAYNTQRVTLKRVILDPNEPDFDAENTTLGPHVLKYMPLCITVNVPGARYPNLGLGLEERELPLRPVTRTFKYTAFSTVHNEDITLKISRRSFAIGLAKSITVHAAQGKTLDLVVADLRKAPHLSTGDNAMLIYTLVSRVRCIMDITFARAFAKSILQTPPTKPLMIELERLANAARVTTTRLRERMLYSALFAQQLIQDLEIPAEKPPENTCHCDPSA